MQVGRYDLGPQTISPAVRKQSRVEPLCRGASDRQSGSDFRQPGPCGDVCVLAVEGLRRGAGRSSGGCTRRAGRPTTNRPRSRRRSSSAGSANRRAPRGLASALISAWQDRHRAAMASTSSRSGCPVGGLGDLGEQDGQVMILAQQARQLLGFVGPGRQGLGPGTRDELHVPPVPLHGLAPGVEGLFGGFAEGIAETPAALAVAALQALDEGWNGRSSSAWPVKNLRICFRRFNACARHPCRRRRGCCGLGGQQRVEAFARAAGQWAEWLSSLAAVRRMTCTSRAPDSSRAVPAMRRSRADRRLRQSPDAEPDQGAQPFQAAAGVVYRVRDVVLAGQLLLGEVDLLEAQDDAPPAPAAPAIEPIGHPIPHACTTF